MKFENGMVKYDKEELLSAILSNKEGEIPLNQYRKYLTRYSEFNIEGDNFLKFCELFGWIEYNSGVYFATEDKVKNRLLINKIDDVYEGEIDRIYITKEGRIVLLEKMINCFSF